MSETKTFEWKNLSGFGGDFTSTPETAALKERVNLRADGGRLTDGLTLSCAAFGERGERLMLPENAAVEKIFCGATNAGERILVAGGGRLYAADPQASPLLFADCGVSLSGEAFFVQYGANGDETVLIVDESGSALQYDGVSFTQYAVPAGAVAALSFNGRLVVVTETDAYVSAEGQPYRFDVYTGGYAFSFGGEIRAKNAVKLQNEIVIAGDRGMCKLVRTEFADTFGVRSLLADGVRLFPATLAENGAYAFLVTERGLASYGGLSVAFSHAEIGGSFAEGVGGFTEGGVYHAVVKSPYNAHKTLVLSFEGEDVCVAEAPITCVAHRASAGALVLSGGHDFVCAFGGRPARPAPVGRFVTPETDFGRSGAKTLTAFSLYTERDVRLTITADGRRRLFRITGGKGRRTIRPYLRGQIFSFSVVAEGSGAVIAAPRAEIEFA